ncbi:MAG: hypothetical protein HY663_03980 [Chloroflexi bacterium]|nr:hypothetical protein [Chloroflexota bacterium]
MMVPDDSRTESLRRLLEQHWLHCRHVESERAWFMNVYAVITGSIVTFTLKTTPIDLLPVYFLLAFTVIGFLLTWRWKDAFQYHQKKAEEIATVLAVPLSLNIPANWFWKIFGTRFLFLYFYAIVLIGLIILLVTNRG